MRSLIAFVMLFAPVLVRAEGGVMLESSVFIERFIKDESGRQKTVLEAPKIVTPGDRLVFILKYRNAGAKAATNFTVTNPMPNAVAFQDVGDKAAELSVDGGRSWGRLSTLKIRETDGKWRGARPEDVTHIRWPMAQPIPVGATGRLSFRGIVR